MVVEHEGGDFVDVDVIVERANHFVEDFGDLFSVVVKGFDI